MKRFAIFAFAFALLGIFSAHSADLTFEDFKKAQMGEYKAYLDAMDKEFSQFLKQQWKEYKGQKPEKAYDKPKPVVTPVTTVPTVLEPVKIVPKEEPKPVVKTEPEKQPEKTPVVKTPDVVKTDKAPVKTVPEPTEPKPTYTGDLKEPVIPYVPVQEQDVVALQFFGLNLSIPYDKKITTDASKPLSSASISKWWENTASSDYKKSLDYIQKVVDGNKLGDWGLVLILERFSAKLEGTAPEQKMLVWFFLNKSGYNTKLGYTKTGTAKVMMPADTTLFGVPYFTFDGVKYYVINTLNTKDSSDSLYTYKGSYPEADTPVRLLHMVSPKLSFSRYDRELKFTYNDQTYKINAVANKFDVAYLNTLPQADLEVYTSAAVPLWVDKTVVPALAGYTAGKSLDDSVNMILRFVQTAFDYKTDDQQFGKEKFFFAEETIYYPYSDCEDRSILFAYLVKKILGKDVVMLNFPNHVATAVDMGDNAQGAYLTYKGKKYTIADPTYINAVAGMVMPEFKGVNPEIEETGI